MCPAATTATTKGDREFPAAGEVERSGGHGR